jgi:hypothetical protein
MQLRRNRWHAAAAKLPMARRRANHDLPAASTSPAEK